MRDQSAFGWCGKTDVDLRTARFAVTTVPRGIGLLGSAFGLRVATRTHRALVKRLVELTNALPAGVDTLDAEVVHTYKAGLITLKGETAPELLPAAAANPKHLLVTAPERLRHHGQHLVGECQAAEALAELKAAGARALPLMQADLLGDGERRNLAFAGSPAFEACKQQRRELLQGMGGAYLQLLEPHDQEGTWWYRVILPDVVL